MPISNINTTATATSQTTDTRQNNLAQKDIFLKLLVAQMKFQDPLKPQDATQMSSQLAQFNMVEQQTNTNTLLKELLAKGNSSTGSNNTAATWLGHSVSVNQNQIHFDGTPQAFSAQLTNAAAQVNLNIFDASGTPVRSMQLGALSAGKNPLTWDGLTDSGATAAIGDYRIEMSAIDLQGQSVKASVSRSGIVDAVRFTSNGNELMVGGIAATIADVTEIRP
ncbi:MAG: flagellar hook capping FlgD N-terminal domain-containing protein [Mariprofundaceae bacterium]|nr:flagellar hook capping FlgD N-terminal domain-containing protein [Mariprofundaceae bacterium]